MAGANASTVKPVVAACYDNNLVNSQGMFLGDEPLRFALPLLLVQVSIILTLSAAAHHVLRRLGQCRFVTHMLVGIFLGPSVLGRNPHLRTALFSERGTYILESVSLVALILFLFSMAVKTDLTLLRRPTARALAVGLAGSLVPLAVTLPVFHALSPSLPADLRGSSLITELAVRLSLSSFPHDVCLLAHSRKANLILLPFHKSSDGARSTANNAIRGINRSVMQYAPCSVGILIDHGVAAGSACATASNSTLQRVALYFLGGADDREALAYVARMAECGLVAVTVVRLKLRDWVGMGGRDEMRDEEALQEFWQRYSSAGAERVAYVEKTVEDGEGTASVVRAMSDKFDLLVVGRREGGGDGAEGSSAAALTSGLSEWSEFPELGVLGDMLASADFAAKVSILVVQQQAATRNDDDY
uniref:Uncharacterized protein n=1 Tax=Oryza rufipogon TaxID=4529 RepID=A0A0E0RCR6_ORYRU